MEVTRMISTEPMEIKLTEEELPKAKAERVSEKHIHFYGYNCGLENCINGYLETKVAIDKGEEYIHTTQMCFLSTSLFKRGYRIFIHDRADVDMYEIKLGINYTNQRTIRLRNNLFKLWESGEFRTTDMNKENI